MANFGAAELGNKKWAERSFFELLNEEKEFAKKTVDDLMQYPYAPKRNPFHPIQQVSPRRRAGWRIAAVRAGCLRVGGTESNAFASSPLVAHISLFVFACGRPVPMAVAQGYSALAVVEALARERGLHRVPVIDSNRRIVNLVTNSQVLNYLNENIDLLGSVLIKTLDACGNRFLKPVSVGRTGTQTGGRGERGEGREDDGLLVLLFPWPLVRLSTRHAFVFFRPLFSSTFFLFALAV